MKKFSLVVGVGVALFVFLVIGSRGASAASTIGTNISTTGTLGVTVDSATAILFQDAAASTNVFVVNTSTTRAGVNSGTTVDTTFEIGGTASISGIITLGGSGSTGGQFRPAADSTTAFRFQNAAGTTNVFSIDTSGTKVGVNAGGTINTTFEVGGTASISSALITANLVVGSNTASSSTIYAAEFVSTATTSVLFGGSSTTKGTCLQLKNTAGQPVYARVLGTTFTVSAVSCH